MHPFHERLARVGLAAADRYGFALAGGYAVQAAGLLDRPSEDVDLFTAWNRTDEFDVAVGAVVNAYGGDGLHVAVELQHAGSFARLRVTDPVDGSNAKVEMGVDWRANDPVRMSIGPVLHPDDAVANKMCALFGRALARDFIDVDAAAESGRYSHEDLLWLAHRADNGFEPRVFADALGAIEQLSTTDFAEYGVTGRALDGLRARFAEWRVKLIDNDQS
ncbi:nucleotidyl transferase AbiEii/AbiGii toxin family protein [Dactylosporangium roseum]|uniref:Nucleotidyl transferase AbiEii/AbiGii toxin family protein n=1 Tax=Dactylosporangium roseum TaxID=47989 RepID=A0ABY5Z5D5_9ACTN|nr:nucleotidyl transferase AbiEii/AbiGii toxin family protein [Dactylosporangium roseum]UWZ37052.1 nucleotidyl transferase AbiEii/AbiGii toxin family protein [Dactylosporangium roseum]